MTECMRGSHNPIDVVRTKKYTKNFYKEHPDYFKPERYNGFFWFSRPGKDVKFCGLC